MSLPAPLMFTVGLIDQITKPIAKISNKLNGLAENYQAGTMQMATGIGGVVASGFALQNALMPAIEMDRALGEVASLGVRDSALKMLTENSYAYAMKYGESAVDFVRSSYDIQSAIGGLNDADLSRFTMASNVLAKATKADAATVTNYMGTMYGIFKNDAQNMGEGAWIERVTGMTATAVQAFKTDGKKMSDAFAALGASAGLAPLEEQMAIMGTLQATMQGSESATKYKSFLAGVGKAQKALNLQFSDANGNMLPMVDILNKIKGKYGETISVAEGDQLASAFGSQEAVSMVKLLLKDVDGLSGSISQLGKVKGMEQAEKMAAAMTDQSQRLSQSWFVIRAAFGAAVLPAFNEFVGKIADMSSSLIDFTSKFPNITRWVGYLGIGLILAVAAGGLFTIMMGAGKMAMTTWAGAAAIWNGAIWLVNAGLVKLRAVMLAVNIAMYANPVGFIVAGVLALIAVIGLAVYYFDDLRNMLKGTAWGEPILYAVDSIAGVLKMLGAIAGAVFSAFISIVKTVWQVLQPVASFLLDALVFALKAVGVVAGITFGVIAYAIGTVANLITWLATEIYNVFSGMFDFVSNGWKSLVDELSNIEWVNNLLAGVSGLGEFMGKLWAGIKAQFAEVWGGIVEQLNKLPGINIAVDPVVSATKLTENMPNQDAMPKWMQRQAANDSAGFNAAMLTPTSNIKPVAPALIKQESFVPEQFNQQLNVQRNLPKPYAPETLTQQQHLQLVKPAAFVPEQLNQQLNVQRNLPEPYTPEKLQQQVDIKPVATDMLAGTITPKYNQQAAASAHAVRKATQSANSGKTLSFGDVIVQNPPKEWSLAELADQQELRTA
ncbi:MAG: phage tail tape measure protein [Rheinheimera sp.]|nr:phage tail tape measure protein [Rheinheimera sp.]